ncbi:MAG: hypothetical protein ACRDWS_09825 [Acidimicrobiia bacterium]
MRRLTVILAASVLVLGGATVVVAQTETDSAEDGPARVHSLVQEVLDELVADGTLTQAQADAVDEALVAKRDELRAEREALRQQLEEFWSDGQITEEEIEQLPESSRWQRLSELLDDGVVEREELRGLRPWLPRWRFGTVQG